MDKHLALLGEHGGTVHLRFRAEEQKHRQHMQQGNPLRRLLQRCGHRYHVLDRSTGDRIQIIELLEMVEKLQTGAAESHGWNLELLL